MRQSLESLLGDRLPILFCCQAYRYQNTHDKALWSKSHITSIHLRQQTLRTIRSFKYLTSPLFPAHPSQHHDIPSQLRLDTLSEQAGPAETAAIATSFRSAAATNQSQTQKHTLGSSQKHLKVLSPRAAKKHTTNHFPKEHSAALRKSRFAARSSITPGGQSIAT
jgi:hypothetical protein